MTLSQGPSQPAEDWREIHTTWQGGNSFLGLSSKGNQIPMGALSDAGASPMEVLLIALSGCTGMDIIGILEKKRKNIEKFELTVRGLRRFENPRIYTVIQVLYELWSDDLDDASLEQAIQLSEEKYCSVSGMLGEAARISSSYVIHQAGANVERASRWDSIDKLINYIDRSSRMINEPVHVTDAAFEKTVLGSTLPVVVDFWAPWCTPCKMVAPILDKLAKEYEGKLLIAKVNTDDNPDWAMKYGVQGIPTMLFVANGKLVHRQVGAMPEPMLRELVNQFMEVVATKTE